MASRSARILFKAVCIFLSAYGRYGYRRITALLNEAGWDVSVSRVARIWRREGLKVPGKQPKRRRLWLADGSCIRLHPERPNHVWAYDFVEDRTSDGRKYRMLNIVDEFTRECLAIKVARKLKSMDVIETLADLFCCAGCRLTFAPIRDRSSSRSGEGLDWRRRRADRLHRARQPVGERLCRELQRAAAR